MDNVTLVALENKIAKHVKKEAIKDAIEPGHYQIDKTVVLRITGTVRKGEESPYTPTVSIPIKATMALLLEKSGITREHSARLLAEAMREAIDLDKKGEDFVKEKISIIDEAEERVKETIDAMPKKMKKGTTTVKVDIDEVDVEKGLVMTDEIIYSSLDEGDEKAKKKKK